MRSGEFSDRRLVSLKGLRLAQRHAKTQGAIAEAAEMQRPNVVRLEGQDSLATTQIETIRRYLDALGYDLALIAYRRDGEELGDEDDLLEIVDPADADEAPPR